MQVTGQERWIAGLEARLGAPVSWADCPMAGALWKVSSF